MVGNGKAVAWHESLMLNVVDLAPPYAHRRYAAPNLSVAEQFVGMTDDERFAVFQADGEMIPVADGKNGTEHPADLGNKYQRAGESDYRSENRSGRGYTGMGQYRGRERALRTIFYRGCQEPAGASRRIRRGLLWKITADGKWEKIEDRDPRFAKTTFFLRARDPQGKWRTLVRNIARRRRDCPRPSL